MPVSPRVAEERATRYQARVRAAEKVVPAGCYCYTPVAVERRGEDGPVLKIEPCPYWKARRDWPEQAYGYCRFLKAGDSSKGRDAEGRPRATLLLWDQVKECGINPDDPDSEDEAA